MSTLKWWCCFTTIKFIDKIRAGFTSLVYLKNCIGFKFKVGYACVIAAVNKIAKYILNGVKTSLRKYGHIINIQTQQMSKLGRK